MKAFTINKYSKKGGLQLSDMPSPAVSYQNKIMLCAKLNISKIFKGIIFERKYTF